MLRNMRISTRLSCGFGLLALIVLGLGLFSSTTMGVMNKKAEEITGTWVPALDAIGSLNLSIMRYRVNTLRLVIYTDRTALNNTELKLNELLADIERDQARVLQHVPQGKMRELVEALLVDNKQYVALTRQILDAVKTDDIERAKTILEQQQRSLSLSSAAVCKLELCGLFLRSKTTKSRLTNCRVREAHGAATTC